MCIRDRITAVGLAVEHVEPDEPALPFFFSREDFSRLGRRMVSKVRRRRARAKVLARRRAAYEVPEPATASDVPGAGDDEAKPDAAAAQQGDDAPAPDEAAPEHDAARDGEPDGKPDIYRGPLS